MAKERKPIVTGTAIIPIIFVPGGAPGVAEKWANPWLVRFWRHKPNVDRQM
jgi:hypothetical protein